MKRIVLLFAFFLPALVASAQPGPTESVWDNPVVLFYVTAGFLFVVSLLVIAVALYMLQVLRYMARNAAVERAARLGIAYQEEPGWWTKFNQWISASVPVEKETTILLDHNYDGIRELDNHLPPWWKWLFYGTIIWSVVYLVAYHVTNSLPLSIQEYNNELAQADEQLRKMKAANPGPQIDENSVQFVTDAVAIQDGKQIFNSICASCHRVDGGGDIGPNLTDEFWKHGGSIKDVFKVVTNGVPSTNMVAWGASMSPEKIQNVSSYVLTMQGSKPANPKAPEGELYKPEQKNESPADTLKVEGSL